MQQRTLEAERPRVILETFKPMSVFICPCQVTNAQLSQLVQRTEIIDTQTPSGGLAQIQLKSFEEDCIGLHVEIKPKLYFLQDLNWAALALFTKLAPVSGDFITFEQMLAFNSNFRVCAGKLERSDNPKVFGEELAFRLSSGWVVPQIYEQAAKEVLSSFVLPEALKRSVTVSIAQFESVLDDNSLYSYGTIAHSDEIVDPDWAVASTKVRAYDRWKKAGIRLFAHSYSLVCSCGPGQQECKENLSWFLPIYEEAYVPLGARMALERAVLIELRGALQKVSSLKELRKERRNWVNSQRVLGVPWTAEKTQRVQVEQLWRQISGLETMAEELDKRFEQTVELFEAEASGRTNKLLTWFQVMVAGIAGGEVTAELTRYARWEHAIPWSLGMAILAMLIWGSWLYYRTRRISERKY